MPAEGRQRQGDGGNGAEQHQRSPDGPALVLGQAIRRQEAEARARGGTGPGDQGEFR